jgi:hypothetical protein
VQVVFVPGNSLILDFPFAAYAHEHLGHWLELLLPVFNVLMEGEWSRHVEVRGVWRERRGTIARTDC